MSKEWISARRVARVPRCRRAYLLDGLDGLGVRARKCRYCMVPLHPLPPSPIRPCRAASLARTFRLHWHLSNMSPRLACSHSSSLPHLLPDQCSNHTHVRGVRSKAETHVRPFQLAIVHRGESCARDIFVIPLDSLPLPLYPLKALLTRNTDVDVFLKLLQA